MQISLIAAMTADGFIGRENNDRSFDWTSPEDKKFYVQKIKQADLIIMGAKTFLSFTKYPKDSNWLIYTKNPKNFKNLKPNIINASATNLDPEKLIKNLKNKNLRKIIICGGASIYNLFMQAGLIDKIYLTIEPVFFGNGVKLFNEKLEKNLELIKIHKLSKQTLVLEYNIL